MKSAFLSCYILTKNSERRLAEVLYSVQMVADEILIVDSGSTDSTIKIAQKFHCKILHRPFDNFRDQRTFAEEQCTHDWVLALDSDEIASPALQKKIQSLKGASFKSEDEANVDGYAIKRDWFFINNPVRNFYPVRTPEFIVRLFNRKKISHRNSRIIHEQVDTRGATISVINESIHHHSCDSLQDLYAKLPVYAKLSAQDLHHKGVKSSWAKRNAYPWLIWFRWHILYKGFLDGQPGIILGKYTRDTIRKKYEILDNISRQSASLDARIKS